MTAERCVQRRFANSKTYFGLEELTSVSDQVHNPDRRLADCRNQLGDLVERRFARRIHHIEFCERS